jgi:hypothetical protein
MRHRLHCRALARHRARFWLNQQIRYAIADRDHGVRVATEVKRTGIVGPRTVRSAHAGLQDLTPDET